MTIGSLIQIQGYFLLGLVTNVNDWQCPTKLSNHPVLKQTTQEKMVKTLQVRYNRYICGILWIWQSDIDGQYMPWQAPKLVEDKASDNVLSTQACHQQWSGALLLHQWAKVSTGPDQQNWLLFQCYQALFTPHSDWHFKTDNDRTRVCDFHVCNLLCWASGGEATNSPAHIFTWASHIAAGVHYEM